MLLQTRGARAHANEAAQQSESLALYDPRVPEPFDLL